MKSYESLANVDLFYRDDNFRKIAKYILMKRLDVINPNEELLDEVNKDDKRALYKLF